MALTVTDIQNLAKVARIDVSNDEAQGLLHDLDATLVYIDQITKADVAGVAQAVPTHRNVVREDVVTNQPGSKTDVIMAGVPDKKDGFVKVKKIL